MPGLPPRDMPLPLRALAWLIFATGIVGLLLNAWVWWSDGTVKVGRIVTAALYTWSGNQLRQGDREGLDYLLGVHGFLLAVLIYAVIVGEPFGATLFLAALWVVVIGGYLAYCRLYLPWTDDYEPGSYQDWLTNPDYREGVAAFFEHRERVLAADREDPPMASALVDELFEDEDEDEQITLARLRQLVESKAKRDEVIAAVAYPLDGGQWRKRPEVVSELIDLLPAPIPVDWADRLMPLLDELPEDERSTVWTRLAEALSPESIDVLVEGLSDADADLWIIRGLITALEHGRGSPATRRQLKPGLHRALDDPSTAEEAARALVVLDSEQLTQVLTASVDWDHRARMLALESALKAGLVIEPRRLRSLFDSARRERAWGWVARLVPWVEIGDGELEALHDTLTERPKVESPSAARAVLAELQRREADGVEARIRATIDRYQKGVSEAAAGLLCKQRGLPECPNVDYEQPLSIHARYYCCVDWLVAFANNGGLIKAVDDLNEENMAAVLPALDAMGLPQMANLWRRVAAVFEVEELPPDPEERRRLIADRYSRVEARFEVLDNEYFAIEHIVSTKAAVFAAEHAEEIRPVLVVDEGTNLPWSDFSLSDPDFPE